MRDQSDDWQGNDQVMLSTTQTSNTLCKESRADEGGKTSRTRARAAKRRIGGFNLLRSWRGQPKTTAQRSLSTHDQIEKLI